MRKRVLIGVCLWQTVVWAAPSALRADVDSWRVVDVSGPGEVLSSSRSTWQPLACPSFIRQGAQLRTGKDGTVDIALNGGRESMIHVRPDSLLLFLKIRPSQVRLLSGSLFVLLEGEGDTLDVWTGRFLAQLAQGGMAEISSGTWEDTVKVFGDQAQLSGYDASGASRRRTVDEGFKLNQGGKRSTGIPARMDFGDYEDWQQWFKKNYDRKDKFLLEKH